MKKNIKRMLIIVGALLLAYYFFISFEQHGTIFDTLLSMLLFILEIGDPESMYIILGVIFIATGIIIRDSDNKVKNNVETTDKVRKKYKLIRILGFLPFVAMLTVGVISSIYGFTFFFSTSYGLDGFIESIIFFSIFCWPLYIIGIILIIKYSQKLKSFEK